MNLMQQQVFDFMNRADQPRPTSFRPYTPNLAKLRAELVREEANEFFDALRLRWEPPTTDYPEGRWTMQDGQPDYLEAIDAICDLLYVVFGAAVSMGLNIEPFFNAVHASNMTKFGPGAHRRADGKWEKSPDWQPPDLGPILRGQMASR